MNEHEARGKAYFIVARFAEVVAHMPELFDLAVSGLDVSEDDMAQVKEHIATTVVSSLQEWGAYHRSLAQHQPRVKVKRKQSEPTRHDDAHRGEQGC